MRTVLANFHGSFNAPEIRQLRHEHANHTKALSLGRIAA